MRNRRPVLPRRVLLRQPAQRRGRLRPGRPDQPGDQCLLPARARGRGQPRGAGSITPGDTHGARITGLILRKSATKLGQIADFVTIGFTYHDLKVGDHISLRFYAKGLTYDLTASLPDAIVQSNSTLVGSGIEPPDSHFRLGLSNKGETTMEVYLNGVSQGEVTLDVP